MTNPKSGLPPGLLGGIFAIVSFCMFAGTYLLGGSERDLIFWGVLALWFWSTAPSPRR